MLGNLSDGEFVEVVSSTLNSIIAPYVELTPLKHLARIEFEKRRGEFGWFQEYLIDSAMEEIKNA